jgi:hypothetical protein
VAKKAVIHRIVMPHHTCPYGLKAKDLLERSGYVEGGPILGHSAATGCRLRAPMVPKAERF